MKKIFKITPLFLLLLSVTSCDMKSFGDDLAQQIEAKLFPNIWAFLVQLIAFIILIIVVIYFGYKPVKKYLNKRQEMLDEEVKSTFEANKKAQSAQLEAEKNLKDSKDQATQILSNAEEDANKRKEKILIEADNEAREIKDKAQGDILRAKENAKASIETQIIDVALDASEKILEREVKSSDNKKLINDFISDLNKEDK